MIVAGAATIAIGMADLYEGFTNYNFLRHGFGWSISKYNKIKLGVTVASIVLSVVCVAYMGYIARTHCFKEGTEVLTEDGNKPIEQIEVDDLVWAYDEATGDKSLKKVVRLFRNTTKQWSLIEVDGETITCTPGHKFYIPMNKNKRDIGQMQEHESYYGLSDEWVSAKDLRKGDIVLLESGKYSKIDSVVTQDLEVLETTYNFEVEDYHTYYVGEKGTLVHNTNCNLERVGRWMSKDEYNAMVDTGVVQEGAGGVTYVARPADITAYASQARSGSVYVEFDVPISSLRSTQAGWGKIIGPNSIDARLMISKGLQPPTSMPNAYNIKLVGFK